MLPLRIVRHYPETVFHPQCKPRHMISAWENAWEFGWEFVNRQQIAVFLKVTCLADTVHNTILLGCRCQSCRCVNMWVDLWLWHSIVFWLSVAGLLESCLSVQVFFSASADGMLQVCVWWGSSAVLGACLEGGMQFQYDLSYSGDSAAVMILSIQPHDYLSPFVGLPAQMAGEVQATSV